MSIFGIPATPYGNPPAWYGVEQYLEDYPGLEAAFQASTKAPPGLYDVPEIASVEPEAPVAPTPEPVTPPILWPESDDGNGGDDYEWTNPVEGWTGGDPAILNAPGGYNFQDTGLGRGLNAQGLFGGLIDAGISQIPGIGQLYAAANIGSRIGNQLGLGVPSLSVGNALAGQLGLSTGDREMDAPISQSVYDQALAGVAEDRAAAAAALAAMTPEQQLGLTGPEQSGWGYGDSGWGGGDGWDQSDWSEPGPDDLGFGGW